MKTLIALALAFSLLPGCASASGHLLTATTNSVPTIVTRTLPQPVAMIATNSAGILMTNWTTNMVQVTVTNWQTNIVYAPSALATGTLSTLSTINAESAPGNPLSPLIAAGVALLSAALGAYASHKTTTAANANAATVISAANGNAANTTAAAVTAAVNATSPTKGT
jgi:hypothetical protein